jgi:hypothetical protein
LPWQGRNEAVLLENIMGHPLSFPGQASVAMREILGRMLAISEGQRASLEEVDKLLELYE